jgi:ATP-dependent DNA ligase
MMKQPFVVGMLRPVRLLSMLGAVVRLISRNGHDGARLFAEPFRGLAGRPPLVLDGEIAVPDERGRPKANPRWMLS